jgi:NitT/TauT family transport system ATP-binding protein
MATLVDIKNLAIAYGKAPPVLAGFTAGLERGSFTAVVGPSGVGKSTLLRVLAGLTAPAAGTVDMPMRTEMGRRPVALVFQEARLLPWRRVLENVSFGLEGTGLSKADRMARARETLDLVGLADMAGPTCCCSTSPSRRWTPSRGSRFRTSCSGCGMRLGRPCCS